MDSVRDERTRYNPDQELFLRKRLIEEVRRAIDAFPSETKPPSGIADAILDAGDPNGSIPPTIRFAAHETYREMAADLLAEKGYCYAEQNGEDVYVPRQQLTEQEAVLVKELEDYLCRCRVSLLEARAIVRAGDAPAVAVTSRLLCETAAPADLGARKYPDEAKLSADSRCPTSELPGKILGEGWSRGFQCGRASLCGGMILTVRNEHRRASGEGGIRTLPPSAVSVSYTFHVAQDAVVATDAVDHCTLLHAGDDFLVDQIRAGRTS
jgi:hypothetical protein